MKSLIKPLITILPVAVLVLASGGIGEAMTLDGLMDQVKRRYTEITTLTARFEHAGRQAQVFANFLLEHWPELAGTPYEVQPALLGTIVSGQRYFREAPAFRSSDEVVYVPQTRHSLRLGFLEFWNQHGGLELFGHPISEEVVDDGITAHLFSNLQHVRSTPSHNRKALETTFFGYDKTEYVVYL